MPEITPVPLAALTTLRVGGTPRRMVEARTTDELVETLQELWLDREPWLVLRLQDQHRPVGLAGLLRLQLQLELTKHAQAGRRLPARHNMMVRGGQGEEGGPASAGPPSVARRPNARIGQPG